MTHELSNKISQLEGPCREIDLAMGELVPEPRSFNCTDRILRNGKPSCPAFTDSLDAVKKFFLPSGSQIVFGGACVSITTTDGRTVTGFGATEELAFASAAVLLT